MDDYYELLGVDADADTDEIRTAYRERKAAIETTSGGTSKTEAAALNKAWNVLSDPYQRGRYDAQRESDDGDDIEVVDDDLDDDVDAAPAARRNARPARQGRQPRELGPPTITLPAGTKWPEPKKRVIAMAIDIFVLLVIFMGFGYAGRAVADSQHPGAFDRIDELTDTVLDDRDAVKDIDKQIDEAQKNNAPTTDLEAQKQAAEAKKDANEQELEDLQKDVAPAQFLFGGISMLVSLLYLLVPATVSGRTLGKRTQHLKVLREDGSKLRFSDAFKRYALIVILSSFFLTFPLLGPITALVPVGVLFAILRWTRNNNMQGVHDRFAKTIVVSDAQN
jgi:hypothetical protein